MNEINLRTLAGHDKSIAAESMQDFESAIRGNVLKPDSPGYHEVRAIWNAMIDRRPGLIACCDGGCSSISLV